MNIISISAGASRLTLSHATELLNIHNAFHQGQYQEVIDFDISSFSSENNLTARILQLRAKIALGQAEDVLAEIEGEDEEPDFASVKALALNSSGSASDALELVEQLSSSAPENEHVQVLGGTVLQAQEKSDEALALLSKHQGSLEA